MLNYIFLILSAALFSSGFLFNKLYSQKCGSGIQNTFIASFFQAFVTCLSMFIIAGFKVKITWFSFGIATLHAINTFMITFMALKAFKYANLSVYSMFMMLGSIIIPSTFGIIFYNEGITVTKVLCFIMIFIALYLSTQKGASDKRAIKYYLAVFLGNGISGILSKIHQSNEQLRVSTESFLFQSGLINLAVCSIIIIVLCIKAKKNIFSVKGAGFALSDGLVNSVGNYFNLFALIAIPISVHSIITTGMTLVFSAVLSVMCKEKISKRNVISLLFALAASVLAVF